LSVERSSTCRKLFLRLSVSSTETAKLGGDKTGNNRWYEEFVPLADAIYDRHLQELHGEYWG